MTVFHVVSARPPKTGQSWASQEGIQQLTSCRACWFTSELPLRATDDAFRRISDSLISLCRFCHADLFSHQSQSPWPKGTGVGHHSVVRTLLWWKAFSGTSYTASFLIQRTSLRLSPLNSRFAYSLREFFTLVVATYQLSNDHLPSIQNCLQRHFPALLWLLLRVIVNM